MKNGLIQEMKRILKRRELLDVAFPMPCYLFVQKYGRSVKEDMKEVSTLLGYQEWFFFLASCKGQEESLINRFLRKQDRQSGLGKHFRGCVLIELSGEEDGKELRELLEYLEEQKDRISPVFTTASLQEESKICRLLERYFFVRELKGECLNSCEQQGVFERTLMEYGLSLEEEARTVAGNFFAQKEWKETEAVERSIRNLAKTVVYEKLLGIEEMKNSISASELEVILAEQIEKKAKKQTIGFACCQSKQQADRTGISLI